jgi:hypothetical protein
MLLIAQAQQQYRVVQMSNKLIVNSPANRQKALAYTRYINSNLERIGRDGWIPISWTEFLESEELILYTQNN